MKKLNGAIIGFGFIASQGHYPAYLKRETQTNEIFDILIIAICDLVAENLINLPEHVKKYSDYEELITKNTLLDFVDIATNAAEHFKIAKLALKNNLHVLCEKPLTVSNEEAEELMKLAKSKNKIFFPCHNYKHAPVVKAIRDVLNSKKIGDVHTVTLQTFRNTHAKGVKTWKTDWRRFMEFSGGGIAMDHGSHSLYLTFEWLKSYPTHVSATAINRFPDQYDTEDNFNAVYQFPTGTAHVFLTWTAGVRKVIYTLQGTKGAIRVEDDDMEVAILRVPDKSEKNINHQAQWDFERNKIESDWMDSSHLNWFNSMFDLFLKAIDENDIENKEILDSINCVKSIKGAYQSSDNRSMLVEI